MRNVAEGRFGVFSHQLQMHFVRQNPRETSRKQFIIDQECFNGIYMPSKQLLITNYQQ